MKKLQLSNRMIVAVVVAQLLLAALVIQVLRSPNRGVPGLQKVSRTEFLMTTVVNSVVYTETAKTGTEALAAAYDEASRLERILDRHRPESDVSKINAAAGSEPVAVSAAAYEVISLALEVAAMTNGALDITVAPLMELWGFGTGEPRVPSAEELQRVLPLVDYGRVRLDQEQMTVFLEQNGIRLDLGGIAKGFIVDRAADKLAEKGVRSAYFDAGGDIRVIGEKPDGSPWRIGIRHPRNRDAILARVELRDQAIVTSGDYERFILDNGIRYHHILDPATGMPARSLASVTVIAPDAFTADALSTAVFVLGRERGRALIESLPGVDAIFVTYELEIHVTSGLEGKVEIMR